MNHKYLVFFRIFALFSWTYLPAITIFGMELTPLPREFDGNTALEQLQVEMSDKNDNGRDDLLDQDWVMLEDQVDLSSLVMYQHGQFKVNPILANVYHDVLLINDLSYTIAKSHFRGTAKPNTDEKQCSSPLGPVLEEHGWSDCQQVKGKTGRDNADDDPAAAIITVNKKLGFIVVAFHGSIGRSPREYIKIGHDGRMDWGANWDDVPAKADSFLIDDAPGVEIHRGFGNNYKAIKDNLRVALFNTLHDLGPPANGEPKYRIFVTGHSKGAALASIAAPVVKRDWQNFASVSVILLSAPKVFNKEGRAWAHNLLGKNNILRINVWGDPVPWKTNFLSIGVLVLDDIKDVNKRAAALHNRSLGYLEGYYGYHYGIKKPGGSIGFGPSIVIPYEELQKGLDQAIEHQGQKFFTDSLFERVNI